MKLLEKRKLKNSSFGLSETANVWKDWNATFEDGWTSDYLLNEINEIESHYQLDQKRWGFQATLQKTKKSCELPISKVAIKILR